MKTIRGPAIFLAQFAGDQAPFDSLANMGRWAAGLGYVGVQIPTWVSAFIDVEKAATSKAYADDLNATADKHGIVITDLASHIIGQLIAVHPAFDTMSDGFAPVSVHGNPKARLRKIKVAVAGGDVVLTVPDAREHVPVMQESDIAVSP